MTEVSSEEFGYLSGVSSDIQTQIDGKISSDDADLLYAPLAGGSTVKTVGPLESGSIVSGFGNITLDNTKTVTAGSVAVDNIVVDGSNVGHKDGASVMTFTATDITATKPLVVSGGVSANSITLNGTAVTATAAQINKLATVTADDTELNVSRRCYRCISNKYQSVSRSNI